MQHFTITIDGTAALLMHNSRLSDPLDPAARALKKISAKRNKTEDDHEEMGRLEHAGGLYIDPDIGPYMPADNIIRALQEGAKKTKRGKKIEQGVFITTDINPLSYDGPRDINGLWADARFRHRASVKVGMARVMRTRPMFQTWRCQADGILDPNVIELDELSDIAETAGQLIGLGDWRPRFGRFTATVAARSEERAA